MNFIKLINSELIASTISNLLATRFAAGQFGFQWTERRYDHDGNILSSDSEDEPDNGVYQTPVYETAADSIPAEIFEKLFHLICSTPHEALLLWHQAIQGILTFLLLIIRAIKLATR